MTEAALGSPVYASDQRGLSPGRHAVASGSKPPRIHTIKPPELNIQPSSPILQQADDHPRSLASYGNTLAPNGSSAQLSTESFQPVASTDSARVLNVYKMLDSVGVRGDGYDEGIELTRERRSASWDNRFVSATADTARDNATKEDDLLARVDRYGFFKQSTETNGSSHHRVILCSRSALEADSSSRPSPARTVVRSAAAEGSFSSRLTTDAIKTLPCDHGDIGRELRRIDKWARMLAVSSRDKGGNATSWRYHGDAQAMKRVRRRVYKGVPDRWRAAAWIAAMESRADGSRQILSPLPNSSSGGIPGSPASSHFSVASRLSASVQGRGRRSTSLDTPVAALPSVENREMRLRQRESWDDARRRYGTLAEQSCEHDVQIDLDVPRTISGHVLFHTRYGRGQRALFKTLHAFSLLCQDCGYCQGMGPIASTLLCYFEPATAYAVLVRLHDDPRYGLHHLFSPGFPGLHESFAVHDDLVRLLMPEVSDRLLEHGIVTSAYATKWYITLFASVVPFATQVRLWDAYFLDGQDVLVLAGVSILWAIRGTLLAPDADFETLLGALGSFIVVEDDDSWMRWIAKMLKKRKIRARIAQARLGHRTSMTTTATVH